MLLWGWRVPFLAAVVTLGAAAVLRYNMPESKEVGEQGSAPKGRARTRGTESSLQPAHTLWHFARGTWLLNNSAVVHMCQTGMSCWETMNVAGTSSLLYPAVLACR